MQFALNFAQIVRLYSYQKNASLTKSLFTSRTPPKSKKNFLFFVYIVYFMKLVLFIMHYAFLTFTSKTTLFAVCHHKIYFGFDTIYPFSSASQVFAPTVPGYFTATPASSWNRTTAFSVPAPKIPSTPLVLYPRATRSCCSVLT